METRSVSIHASVRCLWCDGPILRVFRDSGEPAEQGGRPPEGCLSLAAAVHAGQQPVAAGLQEALPDTADLENRPQRDPQRATQRDPHRATQQDPQPLLQERQRDGGRRACSRASPTQRDPHKPR